MGDVPCVKAEATRTCHHMVNFHEKHEEKSDMRRGTSHGWKNYKDGGIQSCVQLNS